MKPISEVAAEARERVQEQRLRERLAQYDETDLTAVAADRLEHLYQEHPRRGGRISREDFAAGYVSALLAYGHTEAFRYKTG